MKTDNSIEYRNTPSTSAILRASDATGTSRKVEGYALVFNQYSQDLGGFKEVISPEALNGVLERCDVFALINHSIERGVLARSINLKGSLKLEVDSRGLKYSFDAPNTELGSELLEGVRRGDIRSSSFSFTVGKEGQRWEQNGKIYIRTITKFDQIFDVSPVYKPAYLDTSVAVRSLSEYISEDRGAKKEPVTTMTPTQLAYYKQLINAKSVLLAEQNAFKKQSEGMTGAREPQSLINAKVNAEVAEKQFQKEKVSPLK